MKLNSTNFASYAYFSDQEGNNIWWTNNDVIYGPFHTNDNLRCNLRPRFLGDKTSYGGNVILNGTPASLHYPIVTGDFYKDHIDIDFSAVSNYKTNADHIFSGQDKVYITFAGDNIKYKFSETGSETVVACSTFAPNGIIYAENAELHIKGVVKGRFSVVATGSTKMDTTKNTYPGQWVLKGGKMVFDKIARGAVFIDDDITYQNPVDWNDPNAAPTDLLGIVAEQNVLIANNSNNVGGDINIHASIYCQQGGFGVENYGSFSKSGKIQLKGGITQRVRRPVGTFSGGSVSTGFSKDYRYDSRLKFNFPPGYPSTGEIQIYSWLE